MRRSLLISIFLIGRISHTFPFAADSDYSEGEILTQAVSLKLDQASLAQIIDHLAVQANLSYVIPVIETRLDHEITDRLLVEALDQLLVPLGLEWHLRDDMLVAGPRARLLRGAEASGWAEVLSLLPSDLRSTADQPRTKAFLEQQRGKNPYTQFVLSLTPGQRKLLIDQQGKLLITGLPEEQAQWIRQGERVQWARELRQRGIWLKSLETMYLELRSRKEKWHFEVSIQDPDVEYESSVTIDIPLACHFLAEEDLNPELRSSLDLDMEGSLEDLYVVLAEEINREKDFWMPVPEGEIFERRLVISLREQPFLRVIDALAVAVDGYWQQLSKPRLWPEVEPEKAVQFSQETLLHPPPPNLQEGEYLAYLLSQTVAEGRPGFMIGGGMWNWLGYELAEGMRIEHWETLKEGNQLRIPELSRWQQEIVRRACEWEFFYKLFNSASRLDCQDELVITMPGPTRLRLKGVNGTVTWGLRWELEAPLGGELKPREQQCQD